jgi:glyoxylase-like metal-dependent hydrolase (beta-lactamase superfamily II)
VSKSTARPAEGVLVQTSDLWNTNSLVITGPDPCARATVVVDPGWFPEEIAELQAAAAVTPPGRATHVLFTHADYDHVVGWEDFPRARLIAHPKAAERDAAVTEKRITDLDRRNRTTRPRAYRYPPARAFTSPSSLDLGGETMLFFPAPGHQADALFTVLPERHVLLAGDYLSDEEFPFIYCSLPRYRATLLLARDLCKRYGIEQEVPGHGQVAATPEEIEYRILTDVDYLDRLEAAVASARADGLDADEAVKRLADFTFRGQPVASLAKAHADNIRFLYGHHIEE